ncbi:phage/plasmid primase, P4 family [Sulfolobus islandicus L.S.2.15]|uniref:Phage/plasmid primase, P4 family n=1 Tax=Saccharolobus islandicus (strain L.S.2.15 / Lassen \|nr:phage/plasmid primase, P4 family [Sulfolobus islandicus]ACP35559.1 phage/plasmid primase, P4 family [Sulfolobus islandicus L.S.2.15]
MDKLQWAKWFIDHGFAIFPIDAETKKPVIKEWQKYSTTPLTDEEKKQYLEMIEKGYNYAVPGGQQNLVILDFEDKELLKAWISEDELNKLCKSTLCVDTPHGGLHVYVTADEIPDHKFNPMFEKDGKGVADLQSFNSYVVAPGSCINHKFCTSDKCPWKGQDYVTCYIPNNNININKEDLKELLKFLADKGKKIGIELSSSARAWLYEKEKEEESTPEDIKKLQEEMAKYDRYKGKTIDAIRSDVCKKLKENVEPSKKTKQIFKTVYGVVCEKKNYSDLGLDRSRGDWHVITILLSLGVTNVETLKRFLPNDSKVFAPKWGKYFAHTLKKAWKFAKHALEFQVQINGKKETEAKKIAKTIITDAILERFKIKTFRQVTGHNQAIIGVFTWDKKKGVYVPFDKEIRKAIRRTAELLEIRSRDKKTLARLSKRDVDDIFDEIKDLTLTPLPKEPLRIAFTNGTLEWTDTGLMWHDAKERSPKIYAFYYLPWEVKIEEIEKFQGKEITVQDIEQLARGLCPKSLEAFKSWVDDKWVTLFEIIGYTLYPEIKFRKAFMLVGEGKNGKSTFINLVKKILGEYAISISPRELFDSQNRFIVSNLYHKLANAVAESKDYSIDDMDRFKRLTGGDWFTADVKFKDPITFKNIAKLIVASNNMPYIRDTNDKAFWHRWIIIEFPHQFPDDDTWFDKTFTEDEINGIVTVSLLAFARTVQRKHFDFEQTEREVMDIWLSRTDSVYAFISEYTKRGIITLDPKNADLWVKRVELYRLYKDYCIDQGFKGVGGKAFARRVREYFGIMTVLKNVDGKRVRAFVGITIDELSKAQLDMSYANILDEFINYIKNNNGAIKEFWEIVREFGDQAKANRFVTWCLQRRFCYQRGIDVFEIHT